MVRRFFRASLIQIQILIRRESCTHLELMSESELQTVADLLRAAARCRGISLLLLVNAVAFRTVQAEPMGIGAPNIGIGIGICWTIGCGDIIIIGICICGCGAGGHTSGASLTGAHHLHPGSPQLWLSFHSSHILYSLPCKESVVGCILVQNDHYIPRP